DHADRSRLRDAAGPGHRAIPGDGYEQRARSREALPPGLGHCGQRLRQPPGPLRALLRQRSADARAGAARAAPEGSGRGDGARPEVPRAAGVKAWWPVRMVRGRPRLFGSLGVGVVVALALAAATDWR